MAFRFLDVDVVSSVPTIGQVKLLKIEKVPELAQRKAENLHKTLNDVAEENKNVVRRVPSASEVEKWVAQAKELPRAINY